jgi:hypothetical protein
LSYPWITQEENLQHRTRVLDDYEPQSAWWPFDFAPYRCHHALFTQSWYVPALPDTPIDPCLTMRAGFGSRKLISHTPYR